MAETTDGKKKKKKKKAESAEQSDAEAPRKKKMKKRAGKPKAVPRPETVKQKKADSRAMIIATVSIAAVLLLMVGGGLFPLSLFKETCKTSGTHTSSRALVTYSPTVPFRERYAKGEMIVLNPTEALETATADLGFDVVERVPLFGLSMEMLRLRIPGGQKIKAARKKLASRFPRMTIEPNYHFEVQAKTQGKVSEASKSVAHAMIGWEKATAKCGVGLRIGMIDSPVDISHPSLKGCKIDYRTFHDPATREAPPIHGTAIASMLVGRPKWGGLMPGAELKAANMFGVNKNGMLIGNPDALVKAIN